MPPSRQAPPPTKIKDQGALRRAVQQLRYHDVKAVFGISRSYYYKLKDAAADTETPCEEVDEIQQRRARVTETVRLIAEERPEWGRHRVTQVMRAAGYAVSDGNVRTVWKMLRLETFEKRENASRAAPPRRISELKSLLGCMSDVVGRRALEPSPWGASYRPPIGLSEQLILTLGSEGQLDLFPLTQPRPQP